jgi:hypothetical protein
MWLQFFRHDMNMFSSSINHELQFSLCLAC